MKAKFLNNKVKQDTHGCGIQFKQTDSKDSFNQGLLINYGYNK